MAAASLLLDQVTPGSVALAGLTVTFSFLTFPTWTSMLDLSRFTAVTSTTGIPACRTVNCLLADPHLTVTEAALSAVVGLAGADTDTVALPAGPLSGWIESQEEALVSVTTMLQASEAVKARLWKLPSLPKVMPLEKASWLWAAASMVGVEGWESVPGLPQAKQRAAADNKMNNAFFMAFYSTLMVATIDSLPVTAFTEYWPGDRCTRQSDWLYLAVLPAASVMNQAALG